MNSNSASIGYRNNGSGLDSDEVYKQTKSATSMGNTEANFSGEDVNGAKLNGNNEDFSIRQSVSDFPDEKPRKIKVMFDQFMSLVRHGVISLPEVTESTKEKVNDIFGSFKR